jgi:hypothetical protein
MADRPQTNCRVSRGGDRADHSFPRGKGAGKPVPFYFDSLRPLPARIVRCSQRRFSVLEFVYAEGEWEARPPAKCTGRHKCRIHDFQSMRHSALPLISPPVGLWPAPLKSVRGVLMLFRPIRGGQATASPALELIHHGHSPHSHGGLAAHWERYNKHE